MRSILDRSNRNGQILILGSASPDLIKQSSETLAGRISYFELTPFLLIEAGQDSLKKLWMRGGYPDSFLEENDEDSLSLADYRISVIWDGILLKFAIAH